VTGTIRATANDILNQVGVEVGLEPVNDPFSSTDKSYRQMKYLINTAGEELSALFPWDFLRKEWTFTTANPGDTGDYELPSDFLYMMNQSGWDRTNYNPITGPLTPQDWAYLLGRDMVSSTIYMSYRLTEDKLSLYPQPPADGVEVAFEYINRNWVLDSNRTLIGRMLKVKFLEAKGMDTTKAQADLNQSFGLLTGTNKGAPILTAKTSRRSFPYLDYYSIPETGYGN
jgi:hypothetical protein